MADAPELRYVLGVAYPANRVDGHGEFMTAEDVRRAAWEFIQNPEIGLQHEDGTLGHARVVESYIWNFPDQTMTGVDGAGQTVHTGDWLVGAVFDEPTWAAIKAGKFTGWSIQGVAARKPNQEL